MESELNTAFTELEAATFRAPRPLELAVQVEPSKAKTVVSVDA
jgi:hypothetical protein